MMSARKMRPVLVMLTTFAMVGQVLLPPRSSVLACPLCLAPTQTWAEVIAESRVVVLGRLVSSSRSNRQNSASSVFEVIQVHKGASDCRVGQQIIVPEFVPAAPGDTFLLTATARDLRAIELVETFAAEPSVVPARAQSPSGAARAIRRVSATLKKESSELTWAVPEPCTETEFSYITQAPAPETDAEQRLLYFLPFLEHSSDLIATDAWGEFARCEYQQIRGVAGSFRREKLREWIAARDTSPERLSLYGLMLGMCGTDEDADFLIQQIGPPNDEELRFGMEGLMAGLMTIKGREGLDFVRRTRLRPQVSSLEAFAAMQAVQFMWSHEPERIQRQHLQEALYDTLQHEALREISITHLTRWKDWSLLPRLSAVYKDCGDDRGSIRAITAFLVIYLREHKDQPQNEHTETAETLLEQVRSDHPRVVKAVEWELTGPSAVSPAAYRK